jgi:hypothetical protein
MAPGVIGCLFSTLLLLGVLNDGHWTPVSWLWLLWLGVLLVGLTIVVVYFVRRAFWVCFSRSAFVLAFALPIGGGSVLGAFEGLAFDDRLMLVFMALAAFGLTAYLFHIKRTVPYWRLTFAINTAGKIDLENGVFSVSREWAGFPNEKNLSQRDRFHYSLALGGLGSPLGLWLSRNFSGTSLHYVIMGVIALFFFGYAGFFASEAYFAYQLLRLEREIGKPIVMDGYQETGSKR